MPLGFRPPQVRGQTSVREAERAQCPLHSLGARWMLSAHPEAPPELGGVHLHPCTRASTRVRPGFITCFENVILCTKGLLLQEAQALGSWVWVPDVFYVTAQVCWPWQGVQFMLRVSLGGARRVRSSASREKQGGDAALQDTAIWLGRWREVPPQEAYRAEMEGVGFFFKPADSSKARATEVGEQAGWGVMRMGAWRETGRKWEKAARAWEASRREQGSRDRRRERQRAENGCVRSSWLGLVTMRHWGPGF